MSQSPPTTLGKYQIIREIARSNDIVYEAYDPLMNRRVALKEMATMPGSTQQQRDDRRNRFLREARAAGSLTHPNVVTIFEVGEDSGRNFIAMEYLDGHTLRNELDTHGFLAQDRALDIAGQVLQALEYAHTHGVVHRDIKPENIQLLGTGHVKITDFGIARLTFEPNLTMDGQVFGTPSYMSPEQVEGREIDARTDIFALGVVLYEMLSGQKPFAGDSVISIANAIKNKDPEPPRQVNHVVWQLTSRALEKSPGMRYSSAADMLSAVEVAKKSLLPGAVVMDPLAPPSPLQQNFQPYGQPYMPGPPSGMGQAPAPPPIMAAQQQLTPYGTPMPTGALLPGSSNPYQPTIGAPYGAPGTQIPIYYPPPPRKPLLSPSQRLFLTRLILTLLVMGTLFALVAVAISSLGTAIDRYRGEQGDVSLQERFESRTKNMALEDRIRERESLIESLKSTAARESQSKLLSNEYEELGRRLKAQGQTEAAQAAFERAASHQSENPDLHRNVAEGYVGTAQEQTDALEEARYWQMAGDEYKLAAGATSSEATRALNRRDAARSLLMAANALQRGGASAQDVRALLYDAKRLVEIGSPEDLAIDDFLQRVGG